MFCFQNESLSEIRSCNASRDSPETRRIVFGQRFCSLHSSHLARISHLALVVLPFRFTSILSNSRTKIQLRFIREVSAVMISGDKSLAKMHLPRFK